MTRWTMMRMAAVASLATGMAYGQGSLTPPGAPAPTMKTLDQIEPRTPISTVPVTITQPGVYYVAANLSSAGTAITIATNDVVLDLGGFTVDANIPVSLADGLRNVVVRDGTLKGGAGGVALAARHAKGCRFSRLRITGVCGDAAALHLDGEGEANVIENCILEGFSYGGMMLAGRDHIVRNCSFRSPDTAALANLALWAAGSVVEDCVFAGGPYGVYVFPSARGSVIRRCTVNGSSGAAILLTDGATGLRVEDNHCEGNVTGIRVDNDSTNNFVLGNSCVGNTTNLMVGPGNVLVRVDAQADESRVPASPTTILQPGVCYYLTNDVSLAGSSPWVIGSDVKLDLNGHTITATHPLRISGSRIRVYNGKVSGYLLGIEVAFGSDITLDGLEVSGVCEDGGIMIRDGSARVTVSRCNVAPTVGAGVVAQYPGTKDVTVEECSLQAGPGMMGVIVHSVTNCIIRDCTVRNASGGVMVFGMEGAKVQGNRFENLPLGLDVSGSTNSVVTGNRCTACATGYIMGSGSIYGTITNSRETAISPDLANFSF